MSGYADAPSLSRQPWPPSARFLQKPFDMQTVARELRGALLDLKPRA
jgi:hypothetical protein